MLNRTPELTLALALAIASIQGVDHPVVARNDVRRVPACEELRSVALSEIAGFSITAGGGAIDVTFAPGVLNTPALAIRRWIAA